MEDEMTTCLDFAFRSSEVICLLRLLRDTCCAAQIGETHQAVIKADLNRAIKSVMRANTELPKLSMGSTTHKEQWMTDIDEFMEQLSPIPAFDVTDLIGRLTELGEQYRAAEKIDPSNGYRASRQIDQAIEHLLKADRGFHMALAQAEQRAEQAHSEQHTTLKTQEIKGVNHD